MPLAVGVAVLSSMAVGGDDTSGPVSPEELSNPITLTEASARAGKQAYSRLCITCHGLDGKGAPNVEEHLPTPPSDLTDEEWKYGDTDGHLYTVIREGTELGMEPFKEKLNEQRTWHLVNYLRTLAPESDVTLEEEPILENPVPYSSDSIRKGRFLYDNHCALCHADDGSGYTDYLDFLSVPPADFTTGEFKYGAEDGQMFVIIRDGTGSKVMEAFGDRLKDEDMWNLVNYIKRFSQ